MNLAPPPQPPSLLPESAPFTPEQRAWLNGFFSGLISVDGSAVTPLSPAESAALMPSAPTQAKGLLDDGDDGDAPWHDQTLPLKDRMKLADGRPLRRRLMAAMAQQDCGQCGYNCQDYSDALTLKTEERLNLCVPGGKETARMVKTLYAELGTGQGPHQPATPAAPSPSSTEPPRPRSRSRRPQRAARATIRPVPLFYRARASTGPAPRKRPGTWNSILRDLGSNTRSAIRLGFFPRTIPVSPMP